MIFLKLGKQIVIQSSGILSSIPGLVDYEFAILFVLNKTPINKVCPHFCTPWLHFALDLRWTSLLFKSPSNAPASPYQFKITLCANCIRKLSAKPLSVNTGLCS